MRAAVSVVNAGRSATAACAAVALAVAALLGGCSVSKSLARGVVTDGTGVGVAGCSITPHSTSFDEQEIAVSTDSDGSFTSAGLTPGSYTFEATCVDGDETLSGLSTRVTVGEDMPVVRIQVS